MHSAVVCCHLCLCSMSHMTDFPKGTLSRQSVHICIETQTHQIFIIIKIKSLNESIDVKEHKSRGAHRAFPM